MSEKRVCFDCLVGLFGKESLFLYTLRPKKGKINKKGKIEKDFIATMRCGRKKKLTADVIAFIATYLQNHNHKKMLDTLVSMLLDTFHSVARIPKNKLYYNVRYIVTQLKVSYIISAVCVTWIMGGWVMR